MSGKTELKELKSNEARKNNGFKTFVFFKPR